MAGGIRRCANNRGAKRSRSGRGAVACKCWLRARHCPLEPGNMGAPADVWMMYGEVRKLDTREELFFDGETEVQHTVTVPFHIPEDDDGDPCYYFDLADAQTATPGTPETIYTADELIIADGFGEETFCGSCPPKAHEWEWEGLTDDNNFEAAMSTEGVYVQACKVGEFIQLARAAHDGTITITDLTPPGIAGAIYIEGSGYVTFPTGRQTFVAADLPLSFDVVKGDRFIPTWGTGVSGTPAAIEAGFQAPPVGPGRQWYNHHNNLTRLSGHGVILPRHDLCLGITASNAPSPTSLTLTIAGAHDPALNGAWVLTWNGSWWAYDDGNNKASVIAGLSRYFSVGVMLDYNSPPDLSNIKHAAAYVHATATGAPWLGLARLSTHPGALITLS